MLDCVSGSVLANPDFTIVVYENKSEYLIEMIPVSYTHLRAHETVLDLVCRLLLEKKKNELSDLL